MSRKHKSHDTRLTSQMAYKVLNLGEAQKKVYHEIWENSLRGFYPTDREIARSLGFGDPNKVRPRRFELMEASLIIEAGTKICSVTERTALMWKINSELV